MLAGRADRDHHDAVRLELGYHGWEEAAPFDKIMVRPAASITSRRRSGARMPLPDQLPEDIRPITSRNALLLRHESFDDDAENIVAAVLGVTAGARPWDDRGRLGVKLGYAAAGLIAAVTALIVTAIVHFWLAGRPLSASIGKAATTLLLFAGAALGLVLGLGYGARSGHLCCRESSGFRRTRLLYVCDAFIWQ